MKIGILVEAVVDVNDKNVSNAISTLRDDESGDRNLSSKEFSYYAEIVKNYLVSHSPYSFMDNHPKKAGNIIAVYADDVPIMEC